MVNKCVAYGCKTGYDSEKTEDGNVENDKIPRIATFHFPFKKPELLNKWIRFVNRRDWVPTSAAVLCEKHFKEEYISRGKKSNLKWKCNPTPTIHSVESLKRPSSLPTPVVPRKLPKVREENDEMKPFLQSDTISDFSILTENHSPEGFQCKKSPECIIYYNLVFDQETNFPNIFESIKVDSQLHVQLQYNGNTVPLPPWFVEGRNAKLTRISMLHNFPAYLRNVAADNNGSDCSILEELERRKHYKPKGRPPYSAGIIRYALLLRYTSAQAYKLLLEKFPLPSISLLNKIQQGGVDAIKAIKSLREKGKMSDDIILMADEMYLQKGTEFAGGDYVGADSNGNLYKGVVVFMIVGMKESIPYVVKAFPEETVNGLWLSEQIDECITTLANCGFNVRAVVTDNHSANVNAFSRLQKKYGDSSSYFIRHPENNDKRTYLFYDNVHIVKNIRNNLVNAKKIVFPAFKSKIDEEVLNCPAGYISWADLHSVYEKDKELQSNLRKARKLTYKTLHPGNNKQDVGLALSVFDEGTIAAFQSYFPERSDCSGFLSLIQKWWTITNSKQRFSPNKLGNAIVDGDGKTNFLRDFADWIEEWQKCPNFTLSAQTSSALITTLRGQAMLIDELLDEGYAFVLVGRLQSDPIERRFSQYRQMSGGRFLVSLREIYNSERILACRSLIKEGISFWEADLKKSEVPEISMELSQFLNSNSNAILESTLGNDSEEVATTIAGYIAKKLSKRSKCLECKSIFIANECEDINNSNYLKLLSRGGLTVPSPTLADFTCSCFAVLDYTSNAIQKESMVPAGVVAEYILGIYSPKVEFTCGIHTDWGLRFATKIIVNIFFNNKQKIAADLVRKDTIVAFKTRQRRK